MTPPLNSDLSDPDYGTRLDPAPLITFGLPAYNRPELLAEALESIARQTAKVSWEVVVCDDGNSGENAAVVSRFPRERFSYFANRPARGAVGNWNRCLQVARGKWVTILHEDDALYPWFLDAVTPRLRTGLSAVCTKTIQGTSPPLKNQLSGTPTARIYRAPYFLKSSMTPFPGVLFPRELGLRLGGFDPRQGALADYDFWYRLASAGRIEVVNTKATFYRVNPGQWTEQMWPEMLRRMHLLRLRIAREQFATSPRRGRWLARFFTFRTALAYKKRFPERPAGLQRALRFRNIPLSGLPSGWVWAWLKSLSR